jgi:hypothetical protein
LKQLNVREMPKVGTEMGTEAKRRMK